MEESKQIELNYVTASLWKRFASWLFDAFSVLVVGSLLLIATFFILNEYPELNELKEEKFVYQIAYSGLYEVQDGSAAYYVDILNDSTDLTYDQKSDLMKERLSSFFSSDKFFEGGEGEEIFSKMLDDGVTDEGEKMFLDGKRILVNDDYDAKYRSFFESSYYDSLPYLAKNSAYSSLNRKIFLIYTLAILMTYLIPYPFLIYMVPALDKRKRATLGMKFTKIARIGLDGYSIKPLRFLFRSLFQLVFMVILEIPTLLIPLMISIGFLYLNRYRQSLINYLFGEYLIDSESKIIYINQDEYLEKTAAAKYVGIGKDDMKLG
jgi:hypothetical protein